MKIKLKEIVVLYSITLIIFGCYRNSHSNNEVEGAMKTYDHFILKMDVDSIALLYAPNGNLGNIAIGRDSIRNFLNKFKNFKVLSQSSESDSIHIIGDTAYQKGTYHQTVVVSVGDTVTVKGVYRAKWIWSGEAWQIQHMETFPVK